MDKFLKQLAFIKALFNRFLLLTKEFVLFAKGKTSKGQLIKSGFLNLVINFGNKFFVLFSGVILIRLLGKSEYGIYTYVLSLVYVLIIPTEFGLSNLIVRETAKGIAKNKPNIINGVWRWSLRITIFLFVIIIFLSALGMSWGVKKFSYLERTTFLWALSLMVVQALIHLTSSALRGLKYILLGQLPDLIILPGIFIIFILTVYWISPNSLNASTSMILRSLSALIALIFSIIFLLKRTPQGVREAKPIYKGQLWASSAIPLGLSSGLNMIKTQVTILLMGFFVNAGQISTFQVATSTSAIAGLVLYANNTLLAPQFASLFAKEKMQDLQQLVTLNTKLVFFFNLIITIIFIIFGKLMLSLVFGQELIEAYPSLLILLIGQLINSLVGSVGFLLNMTGFQNDVIKVVSLTSLVNIIITLILTPVYGIIGGSIAISVSLVIAQIIMTGLVNKRLGIVSHAFYKSSFIDQFKNKK